LVFKHIDKLSVVFLKLEIMINLRQKLLTYKPIGMYDSPDTGYS